MPYSPDSKRVLQKTLKGEVVNLEYGSCLLADQVTTGTSRRIEMRLIVTKGTGERAISLHRAALRREANAG